MILLGGRQGGGAEAAAPAKVGAAAAGTGPKKEGKEGSFEDFPEALDAEDDDLPF
jgi:hypothetical protein